MCGIVGIAKILNSRREERPDPGTTRRMAQQLTHRGPDGLGVWCHPELPVALGHTRLAIQDLSEAGHQPMTSSSGRITAVFNGEIYNFRRLAQRDELRRVSFRGHSDTEVLVEMIDAIGVHDTLSAITGMFAIAIWDEERQTITLARDRVGEKPLYYGLVDGQLVFASEPRALVTVPGFRARISSSAIASLLRYGFIAAPLSIYEGVYKLPPGTTLEVPVPARSSPESDRLPRPRPYWTTQNPPFDSSRPRHREIADDLNEILRAVVADQVIADVPVGAFLSGGIDSTLVAALLSEIRPGAETFTIGFKDKRFDEAPFARAVAEHLGTKHSEHYVSESDLLEIVPQLPNIYDEPFADASQVPTALNCRIARQSVKVILTGDGGDELFGGYNRYRRIAQLLPLFNTVPGPLRTTTAALARIAARAALAASRITKSPRLSGPAIRRLEKLPETLAAPDARLAYMRTLAAPYAFDLVDATVTDPITTGFSLENHPRLDELDTRDPFLEIDLDCYLPDDNLVKVDRASMAVGLECRAPLLDLRVLSLARSLAWRDKVRAGRTKVPLRAVLDRYVPGHLIDRPKVGFTPPLDNWLRFQLRDWARTSIDRAGESLSRVLDPTVLQAIWNRHQAREINAGQLLWAAAMLGAWESEVSSTLN